MNTNEVELTRKVKLGGGQNWLSRCLEMSGYIFDDRRACKSFSNGR